MSRRDEKPDTTFSSQNCSLSTPDVTKADDDKNLVSTVQHVLPEGGWGWFVVLGSFLAHLIIGGLMRSGGVVFLRLEEKFSRPAADTAWAVSLHITFRLLLGPVASAVCNKFSCRSAVIAGGLLTAVGLLISGFTPNLWFLYFSNGLLSGLGQALIYTASVVVVGLYFHRRRGTAVGIANAGIGAGTFMFPPLIKILFEEYGFLGAFLLWSGLSLNFCVCGALYRSLNAHEKIIKPKDMEAAVEEVNVNEIGSNRLNVPLSRDDLRALSMASLDYDIHISTSRRHVDHNSNLDLRGSSKRIYLSKNDVTKVQNENDMSLKSKLLNISPILNARLRTGSDVAGSKRPKVQDIHSLSDSVKSLPNTDSKHYKDHTNYVPVAQSPLVAMENQKSEDVDACVTEEDDDENSRKNSKRKLLDFSPLKDVRFAALCISMGFCTLSFQSAFVFLPPLVINKGLKEMEGAYLVSITGAVETIGSITSGMIIDIDCISPYILEIYTVAIFVMGVCSLVIPFLTGFIPLAFVCGLYGYTLGSCLAQKATLVVEITSLGQLVSAFGILVGFQGVGTLIGPPLAGFLKDLSGRYEDGFYLGGGVLLVAGVLQGASLFIYSLKRKRTNL